MITGRPLNHPRNNTYNFGWTKKKSTWPLRSRDWMQKSITSLGGHQARLSEQLQVNQVDKLSLRYVQVIDFSFWSGIVVPKYYCVKVSNSLKIGWIKEQHSTTVSWPGWRSAGKRNLTVSQSLTGLCQVFEAHTKKLMNLLTGLIIHVGQGYSKSFNTMSLTQSVRGLKPFQRPLRGAAVLRSRARDATLHVVHADRVIESASISCSQPQRRCNSRVAASEAQQRPRSR